MTAYCWHGCGRRARSGEPVGVTGDSRIVEALVCGRRYCRLRAKIRHATSELLDAIGA